MRSKNGRKRKIIKAAIKASTMGTRSRASKSKLSCDTRPEVSVGSGTYGLAGDLFWRYGKCVWVTI